MSLEEITEQFTCLPITNNTIKKIDNYAKIVGSSECYGFLVSPIDSNDGIVYDAMLAPNQEVSAGHARIGGEAAAMAKEEIESKNYKALGFWHSHGNFDTFHSQTDDNNMEHLMLSFARDTEEKEKIIPEGYTEKDGKLIFRVGQKEIVVAQEKEDIRYLHGYNEGVYSELLIGMERDGKFFINDGNKRIYLDNAKNINVSENNGRTLKSLGIAYSIVVNNKGKHFAQIGISKWCDSCERLETKTNEAELKMIKVENDINFKKEDLKNEIKEKINRQGWWG
jgi:proteasome lid subunit RPN8/RPN11